MRAAATAVRESAVVRIFARRRLIVTMEDETLRAVLFFGRRVRAWAAIPIEGTGEIVLPPALARYVRGRTRTVVDLPFYATMLSHLKLPKVSPKNLRQVVPSQVSETLPFSLESVDLVWQMASQDDDPEIFAAAVPRNVTDAHLRQLRALGLRPKAVFSREVAMAAAAAGPGVIGYVHDTHVDVVFAHRGVPRVAHRSSFPASGSVDERAAAIIRAVEEAIAYEEGQEPWVVADGAPSVLIAGPAYGPADLQSAVEALLGERVGTLALSIEHPDDFPIAEYLPHVGLLLADSAKPGSRRRGRPPSVSRPGNVPPRHRYGRVSQRAVAMAALALVLMAGAAAGTLKAQSLEVGFASASAELQTLEDVARIQRLERMRTLAQLQLLPQVNERIAALTAMLNLLDEELRVFGNRIRAITADELTPGTQITSVLITSDTVHIVGSAASHESLVAYALALRDTGLFDDVRIKNTNAVGVGGGDIAGDARISFELGGTVDDEDDLAGG